MERARGSRFFWVGPFGILVPKSVKSVPCDDGINMLSVSGFRTTLLVPSKYISPEEYAKRFANGTLDNLGTKEISGLTEEQYKAKYASLGFNGNWYYEIQPEKTAEPQKGYWKGPYGIWVPNSIKCVPSHDGVNKMFSDGTETRMCADPENIISEEQYKNKYAEHRHGCSEVNFWNWYWKEC